MIETYKDHAPQIDETAFVHAHAVLIGDVHIGAEASIWPGVVLRGDQGAIHIGAQTSIQDGSIGHATGGLSTTTIGARCTVGHKALLHGCIFGIQSGIQTLLHGCIFACILASRPDRPLEYGSRNAYKHTDPYYRIYAFLYAIWQSALWGCIGNQNKSGSQVNQETG